MQVHSQLTLVCRAGQSQLILVENGADCRSERFRLQVVTANDRLSCVIESLDGTWHRPFTTFEMAALQSLVEPEEQLELDGLSDQAWRERIGNAVPPDAAEAIAGVMARTLLLAKQGETFLLSHMPVWVRPIAVGLTVATQQQ